jgi:hypothetical protein
LLDLEALLGLLNADERETSLGKPVLHERESVDARSLRDAGHQVLCASIAVEVLLEVDGAAGRV